MKKPSTNRLGSRRGNALVEFALASFILIPMSLGAFQFGYTFYVYNLLCSQIRAAARYGSIRAFYAADRITVTISSYPLNFILPFFQHSYWTIQASGPYEYTF